MFLKIKKIIKKPTSTASIALVGGLLCALGIATAASGQATSQGLTVHAVAEVETETQQDGRRIVKLAPATRVVPGDQVIYTLEIRNITNSVVAEPIVTFPVPNYMSYVADSASGPGADITFSLDGGREFNRPENLYSPDADHRGRPAAPVAYTHIRWTLKARLQPHSVAFARFRAVVK